MIETDAYTVIAHLFPRALGLIFFFTFGAFAYQIKGLLGSHGILPIKDFLGWMAIRFGHKRYYYVPTLFWINSSDKAIVGLVWIGLLLSILLMLGVYPWLMLLLLYLLYLSLDAVGQEFLGFGWEGFLLEMTFYTFLLSLTDIPNLALWICLNFLLFRFHFQAGAVKIQSHDKNWKNLSALAYHYQTQPLPNTMAWYIHKMPLGFHQISTAIMFTIEMVVPFGIFFTQEIRLYTFVCLAGLQCVIWLTGNLSFLNHLTFVLCLILLNNDLLLKIYPFTTEYAAAPLGLNLVLTILGSIFMTLQLVRFWNHFFPDRRCSKWLGWLAPLNLVCRYGIFAVMTTERYEIIIEGSDDRVEWKEYLFKYKPSEVERRPRRVSPFQPRLDWQVWFLPFTSYYREPWFQLFLVHLLKGTPDVLKLLRFNPFPLHPPKYIRASTYDYSFTSFEEKKQTGAWWSRRFVTPYSPTLSLKDLEE